jgi:hypothetical protein
MRIVASALVACIVACIYASLGSAGARAPANYGVRVAGPVDGTGMPTHGRVTVGAPFWLRVELYTDGTDGAASVSYDLYMPTDFRVVLKRVRLPNGAVTSSCLRACTVGWNSARSRRLFVYYALIAPVPAEFMIAARIVGTNHEDTHGSDDSGHTMIVAVPPRLTLGTPQFENGAPVAGRTFRLAFAVNRSGTQVSPSGARCTAVVRGRSQQGVAAFSRGEVRCAWAIPPGAAGTILRTSVTARAGSLRASTSWSFAIRASQ